MRTGILTFHFADNYGAVLQAYSLKSYLDLCGERDVEIINYVSSHFQKAYSINPLKQSSLKLAIKAFIRYPAKIGQAKKFESFRKKDLGICSMPVVELHSLKYDKIIVGSDQVWNFSITYNDINYFLPISGPLKYAYAASANNSFVGDEYYDQIKNLLGEFDSISVREKQLKEILNDRFYIKCDVVLDPVFLLPKSFWEKECKAVRGIPSKYILVYALERNPRLENTAKKLRNNLGIPVFVIHPLATHVFTVGKLLVNIGPREFIELIRNATVVVSNSFHAFAFSMIFSREIYFDYVAGTSNRVSNMIKMFDMKTDYMDDLDIYHMTMDMSRNCDYQDAVAFSQKYVEDYIVKGKRYDFINQ